MIKAAMIIKYILGGLGIITLFLAVGVPDPASTLMIMFSILISLVVAILPQVAYVNANNSRNPLVQPVGTPVPKIEPPPMIKPIEPPNHIEPQIPINPPPQSIPTPVLPEQQQQTTMQYSCKFCGTGDLFRNEYQLGLHILSKHRDKMDGVLK